MIRNFFLTRYYTIIAGAFLVMLLSSDISAQEYTVCKNYREVVRMENAKYPKTIRITSPGSAENPGYHGFFFYNCSPSDGFQFDSTGRYMLGLKVTIEGRIVRPTDLAYVGFIDRQDNYKWTEVGRSTAWNWQQGCRLQWIPGSSEEFYWNDRADDGKSLVCRIYNLRTRKTRVLHRPVYTVSPDGLTALTHDFERMLHGGTNYVGIEDKFKDQWAPEETGIYKMDLKSGRTEMIISIAKMADIIFGKDRPANPEGILYFFREGFNPSGTRFIAFVKDVRDGKTVTYGYSMTPNGKDVRFLYMDPSHHYWVDDETILDWGRHTPPGKNAVVKGYYIFKDDNSGKPREMLWEAASNGHDSYHPNGDWILTDTYNLNGYQYLYLYHLPTKLFVPLGKFEFRLKGQLYRQHAGTFRVDLHPRFSPDGNWISFDSTHEGLGRQIYMMDVSHIIKNPPKDKKPD